jgi:coenzyme F420-reducing hydrogenase gamma subunit
VTVSADRVVSCDCHACELGDPAMCYGCPTHGAWCDWLGIRPARSTRADGPPDYHGIRLRGSNHP